MSDDGRPDDERSDEPGEEPPDWVPLPPRDPKPWYLHWAADSIVAFLLIVPFFLANISMGVFLGLVLGAGAMPFTQRLELKHLAEREKDQPG